MRKSSSYAGLTLAVVGTVAGIDVASHASTINFTGGTSTAFNVATNWDLNRTPNSSTAVSPTGDVVGISSTTTNQPVFTGPYSLNGVEFTNAAGGASLTGTGTLTLGSAGINSVSTSGVNTFGTGMTVAQDAGFDITVAAGGQLDFRANLNSSSTSTKRLVTKKSDGTLVMYGVTNDKTYFVISAGTVKLGANDRFNENDVASFTVNAGTFDLNNFKERIRQFSGAGGTVTNTGGSLQLLSIRNQGFNETTGTYAGNITGKINLELKSDNLTDVLRLTGVNNYQGFTAVNKGTLYVDGSIAGTGVTISLGTLGGGGTVSAPVTVGDGAVTVGQDEAVLQPGKTSVGVLTITGSLTFMSDGALASQLKSGALTMDKVVANGVALGNGIASLLLTDLDSATITGYHSWTLIDNTSAAPVTGYFENLAEGASLTVGANTFRITYAGGVGGNDVVLSIPEPASMLLLGAGLILILGRRRVEA